MDVGQADCTIVQYGNSTMIIDAGGNASAASLVSTIKKMNITKFDIVIGTHPHEDHIGGLDAVINNFQIGTIYMPKVSNNTKTFEDLLLAIKNKGITAVDSSGNVYVGGFSTATWGSPVRAYTNSTDAFAAKLNSSGTLLWNTFLGGSGGDCVNAIGVDGSGNVYVGGSSDATWGSPVRAYTSSSQDAFAAKLNSSGALLWNTFLGGSGNDSSFGIAVDGSGNVYVGGSSDATWQGTSSPVRAYTSGYDAFAAKLNSSGALQWNAFLGGNGFEDVGSAIAVDGSGNVYVGGSSDATWGSPVRDYFGSGYDAFAAKLDSSGAIQWNTFLGGSGTDFGYGIAVDSTGNVFVGGRSDATWGSPVRAYSSAPNDGFAAKLNSSGVIQWNAFTGGTGDDQTNSIAVDGSGNVYIGGYSTASWGSPVRAFTPGYDAFVAKLGQ